MTRWDFALAIDPGAETPVFLQIARAIADGVREGRLRPGEALPSSRHLAETLLVHRNTVLAAYGELQAEGWISMQPAVGTFVSRAIPETRPQEFAGPARPAMPRVPGFDLPPPPRRYVRPEYRPGTLVLGGGTPDVRLIPADELSRAYRRALRLVGPSALNYGDPRGHERLRTELSAMLSSVRGVAANERTLLLTRGSQMALYLVAHALVRPGDVVAVEGLGYQPAWEAFRTAGAQLVPMPVDRSGLCLEPLERLLATGSVRAVYLTPHHQYPTTVTLDPGRRLCLLELAQRHRVALIEDDYDNEFHFEGRPILPMASADRAGVVVYLGTLSKILAPGLRIGFVVAPEPLIAQMAELRLLIDRQGDQAMEYAVAELISDGAIQRHVRKMRRVYRDRRDALAEALSSTFGDEVSFQLPAGGLALWAHFPATEDLLAWSERAADNGVGFSPAARFALDGSNPPFARLGYAALREGELAQAVARMARCARTGH